ncbi:MAG: PDZ domain-containing protein [Mycobacteriales bacterium]
MSRRALTLLLASLLAVGLAVAGASSTVPYVALTPGPAYDTLGAVGGAPVLSITGHQVYKTDGALDLTTVSVRDKISLLEALQGWLSSSEAVVPREILFPPDQTQEQTDQENTQQMQQSQDAATTAALHELGLPSTTTVVVADVTKGAPADGKLEDGDVLRTVDGVAVKDMAALRALISRHQPGESVVIGYTRDGRPGTVTVGTVASTDPQPRPLIGIVPQEHSTFPVKVDITLKDVGGPSAGLMFALGILEKLGPESLTGGRHIAGTGEITADGKVGAIGGIAEKMRGARAVGATVFLAPADNCAEAKASKPAGLTLARVSTLKDALAALATLRAGGTPRGC